MTDTLRVRVYNVRFGDAILVTVPDRSGNVTTRRNILIDVGNVLSGAGGEDAVFQPVLADVLGELGRPLDLYVSTHEHLDHVQGLYHAATRLYPADALAQQLDVQYAWLTASAAPDYADRYPDSRKQTLYREYDRLLAYVADQGPAAAPFHSMLLNNNPRSTSQCIDFLRKLAPAGRTFYVHRQTDLAGKHPFREAQLQVWAPEADSSTYYGRGFFPMGFGDRVLGAGDRAAPPAPPAGVDAGAFYDLVAMREAGIWDTLLAIDRAANNTSIVFSLTWRGKVLVFAGDAELKSWAMMDQHGVLQRADFLKVSHHGSHNGTPATAILDKVLPAGTPNARTAAISTWRDTYGGIPDTPTNEKFAGRATLSSTLDDDTLPYRDFTFEA